MSVESPEPTGQVVPLEEDTNRRQRHSAADSLGRRLVTIEVCWKMAEMERVFDAAGDRADQMDALATLRRWQFDPQLDSASRRRASALVWRFQPNGWDEV